MGAAENRAKNQAMAAHMLRKGIYHGKRTTTTHAPAIPVNETGSAAYRRLKAKAGAKNRHT